MTQFRDDSRTGAAERLSAYAAIGLMVGMLVVASHHATSANRSVAELRSQLASAQVQLSGSKMLVTQLMTDHDLSEKEIAHLRLEIDQLKSLPPTVLVRRCDVRPTPAFPRESKFVGSHQ